MLFRWLTTFGLSVTVLGLLLGLPCLVTACTTRRLWGSLGLVLGGLVVAYVGWAAEACDGLRD